MGIFVYLVCLTTTLFMADHHPYLNNLTPLRGVAALWVAVFHFKGSIFIFSHPEYTMLAEKGYMMVDLFFIMSGFIIRHVYGDNFTKPISKLNLRKFFIARVARIYPLHLFTLAFLVVLTYFSGDWNIVNDPAAIPTNILLIHSFGIHKIYTWNRHSWSLSAEWAAYMVFPLLALFFNQKGRLAYIVLIVFVVLSYIALLYWLPPAGYGNADRLVLHKLDVTYDYGFLRGIAGFTLGMLCYGLYSKERLRLFFSKDSVAFVCILATLFCMHLGVNDLLLIVSFAGLVLSFASNCEDLHKICSLKALQFVGKVSYSIYLIQGLVAMLFLWVLGLPWLKALLPPIYESTAIPGTLYVIVFLAFLTGLSSITYYGLENPCRNFINRHFKPTGKKMAISAGNS
jgi:peptidoglycan/LPS O-acetylase OafA/YrhL